MQSDGAPSYASRAAALKLAQTKNVQSSQSSAFQRPASASQHQRPQSNSFIPTPVAPLAATPASGGLSMSDLMDNRPSSSSSISLRSSLRSSSSPQKQVSMSRSAIQSQSQQPYREPLPGAALLAASAYAAATSIASQSAHPFASSSSSSSAHQPSSTPSMSALHASNPDAIIKVQKYKFSQCFKEYPHLFEIAKISAVDKYISDLDIIPEKFRAAETIFLSNNSIADLGGLRQFRNARVVSIANNCIEHLAEIEKLSMCTRLTVLNLEFNPISQIPNYRAHILKILPGLKILDNKEVTAKEKSRVDFIVRKEETCLNLMFSNECLIGKLSKGIEKIKLHNDLRKITSLMFKSASSIVSLSRSDLPTITFFDGKKFLQMVDFECAYTAADRVFVMEKLKRDVRRSRNLRLFGGGILRSSVIDDLVPDPDKSASAKGKKSSKPMAASYVKPLQTSSAANINIGGEDSWDIAFSEVMLAQQHSIARLLTQLEEETQRSFDVQQKFINYDPLNTQLKLQETQDKINHQTRQEKDVLIREFSDRLTQVMSGFEVEEKELEQMEQDQEAQQFHQQKQQTLAASAAPAVAPESKPQKQYPFNLIKQPLSQPTQMQSPSIPHLQMAKAVQYQQQEQQQYEEEQQYVDQYDSPLPPPPQAFSSSHVRSTKLSSYSPSVSSSVAEPALYYSQPPNEDRLYYQQQYPDVSMSMSSQQGDEYESQNGSFSRGDFFREQPSAQDGRSFKTFTASSFFSGKPGAPSASRSLVVPGLFQSSRYQPSVQSPQQQSETMSGYGSSSLPQQQREPMSPDTFDQFAMSLGGGAGNGGYSAFNGGASLPPKRVGSLPSGVASLGASKSLGGANSLSASSLGSRAKAPSLSASAISGNRNSRISPSPTASGGLPEREFVSRVLDRAKFESSVSPALPDGADEVTALRHRIEILQNDIETRVHAEAKLQNLNAQLRARLEEYQRQNQENVEQAERELGSMQMELDAANSRVAELMSGGLGSMSSQASKRLEIIEKENEQARQLLAKMEEEILNKNRTLFEYSEKVDKMDAELRKGRAYNEKLESLLAASKADLVKASTESEYIRQKAEEYSEELRYTLVTEQHDDAAELFRRTRLIRWAFHHLVASTQSERRLRIKHLRCAELHRYRMLRGAFHAMILSVRRYQFRRQAQVNRLRDSIRRAFAGWIRYTMVQRRIREATRMRIYNKGRLALAAFSQHVLKRRFIKEKILRAMVHYNSNIAHKCFDSLRSNSNRYTMTESEERFKTVRALHARNRLMAQSCLAAWRRWIRTMVIPKRQVMAVAYKHYFQALVRRVFDQWRSALDERRSRLEKASGADKLALLLLRKRYFKVWLNFHAAQRVKRDKNFTASAHWMHRFFIKWRQFTAVEARSTAADLAAAKNSRRIALRRRFRLWKEFVAHKQLKQAKNLRSVEHHFFSLKRAVMRQWHEYVEEGQRARAQQTELQTIFLRKVFHSWRNWAGYSKRLKASAVRAMGFKFENDKSKIHRYFRAWRAWMDDRRKLNALHVRLATRFNRILMRNHLHAWQRWVHSTVRESFNALREHVSSLQNSVESSYSRANGVDLENLQLIDRLQQLTTENSRLGVRLAEKDVEIAELQRTIEENLILENSLRSECERFKLQIQDLETEIDRLRNTVVSRSDETTVSAIQLTIDLQNAETTIRMLRAELEDKENALAMAQSHLGEAQRRVEDLNSQSQEKLAAAFEIAASLRKMVEDKDSQLAEAAAQRDQQDLKLTDFQYKLTLTTQNMTKAIEERDVKIHEMQGKINALQSQVNESSTLVTKYSQELEGRESELKKLRYEVQYLSQREERDTQQFLSELNRVHNEIGETISSSEPYLRDVLQDASQQQQQQQQASQSQLQQQQFASQQHFDQSGAGAADFALMESLFPGASSSSLQQQQQQQQQLQQQQQQHQQQHHYAEQEYNGGIPASAVDMLSAGAPVMSDAQKKRLEELYVTSNVDVLAKSINSGSLLGSRPSSLVPHNASLYVQASNQSALPGGLLTGSGQFAPSASAFSRPSPLSASSSSAPLSSSSFNPYGSQLLQQQPQQQQQPQTLLHSRGPSGGISSVGSLYQQQQAQASSFLTSQRSVSPPPQSPAASSLSASRGPAGATPSSNISDLEARLRSRLAGGASSSSLSSSFLGRQ